MKFAFLIIISLVLSCQNSAKEKKHSINPKKQNELIDSKTVILINSEYNDWLHNRKGYKMWSPDMNDIKLMDNILKNAIDNNEFDFLKNPTLSSIKKNYYRQLIPYIDENGNHIIEINAFCDILDNPPDPNDEKPKWTKMDWKNYHVLVDDGGDCYWQIKINIDKEDYINYGPNGL